MPSKIEHYSTSRVLELSVHLSCELLFIISKMRHIDCWIYSNSRLILLNKIMHCMKLLNIWIPAMLSSKYMYTVSIYNAFFSFHTFVFVYRQRWTCSSLKTQNCVMWWCHEILFFPAKLRRHETCSMCKECFMGFITIVRF